MITFSYLQVKKSIGTTGVLRCDQLLPFWVKWENGTISLGSGTVGAHQIGAWTDPEPYDIRVAAFSTYSGSAGEWDIDMGTGTVNPFGLTITG